MRHTDRDTARGGFGTVAFYDVGSSGLLYAAIVAAWAAVLVPRWIRRNEEIERAREEDASKGVRVLDREQRQVRAHAGLVSDRPRAESRPSAPTQSEQAEDATATEHRPAANAATRRRRVLVLLLVAVGGTAGGAGAGLYQPGVVAVPASLLLVFLVLARRAAVTEARRRRAASRREALRRRALAAQEEQARPTKRVAVLDEPAPPALSDPHAWQPVPVPRPTYLSKPKAEPRVVRKIDLSSPGAWTSGRLNADSTVEPPPPPAARSDVPERRRAVGD